MQSYAVLGTGAVGGFYGAMLASAGHEVHFLMRSDLDHVREHGLVVESILGDVRLDSPLVHAAPASIPEVDVVLVALKTTANDALAELLPSLAARAGLVVLLQNGLGIEGEVAPLVGSTPLAGGLCFLCSNKVGPGHIRHLDYGTVNVGLHTPSGAAGGTSKALAALALDFEGAGLSMEVADDLVENRWRKLVWNVPFNGLSVVLDATTDELMADPATRQLAADLMGEVRDAAQAQGREIPDAFIDTMLTATAAMTPYRTSMKIDADEGRPLEVRAIFENPVRAAWAGGVAVPAMAALWRQLEFLDRRASRR